MKNNIFILMTFVLLSVSCTSSTKKESNTENKPGGVTISTKGQQNTPTVVDSLELQNSWLGKYSYLSQWYGVNGNKERIIEGEINLTIKIKNKSGHFKISYNQAKNPSGKILAFSSPDIAIAQNKLSFTFTDNWGNEGKGTFKNQGNGIYASSLKMVKQDPNSPVSSLYDHFKVLKHQYKANRDITQKYYNELAEKFYRQQNFKQAAAILDLLTSLYPSNERAIGNYALTLIKQNELEKAEKIITNLLANTTNKNTKASSYFNLGLLYEKKGNLVSALEYYVLSNYLRPVRQAKEKILKLGKLKDIIQIEESEERFDIQSNAAMSNWLANSEYQWTLTPEESVSLFYSKTNEITNEGDEKVTVTSSMPNDFISEVTLIHDNLPDDSVKAIKYVVQMALINQKWEVVFIKSNVKCYKDRGHTYWDTSYCK